MARGEVTGKKPAVQSLVEGLAHLPRGPPAQAKLAFSIVEFCELHGISRAHYYNLKKVGLAPLEMHLGGRKAISIEAAAAWRRAREVASSP
jgi:hypothetical protein